MQVLYLMQLKSIHIEARYGLFVSIGLPPGCLKHSHGPPTTRETNMTPSCLMVGTLPLWSLLAEQELNHCIEKIQGQQRHAGPTGDMPHPGHGPVNQRHDDGATHHAGTDDPGWTLFICGGCRNSMTCSTQASRQLTRSAGPSLCHKGKGTGTSKSLQHLLGQSLQPNV